MKNSKGITMISLVAMIVILMILGTITMYYGNSVMTEAKLQDLKTNMLLIQASLKADLEQCNFEIQTAEAGRIDEIKAKYLKGQKIEENSEVYSVFQDNSKIKKDSNMTYYFLSSEEIVKLGIKDVESNAKNGYYIVGYSVDRDTTDENYENKIEVINTKGYKGNYSLEEIETII